MVWCLVSGQNGHVSWLAFSAMAANNPSIYGPAFVGGERNRSWPRLNNPVLITPHHSIPFPELKLHAIGNKRKEMRFGGSDIYLFLIRNH